MPRKRFENLDPERRERLLSAAGSEFAEHGFESASLNRILEEADLSKGSLYYYFDDKADLFSTVLEQAMLRIVKAVGGFSIEDLTAENYWKSVENFWASATRFLSKNAWYSRLARTLYRIHKQSPASPATSRMMAVARHWTALTLQRGQAIGAVRNDLPLSLMVEMTLAAGEAGDYWLFEHWDELTIEDRARVAAGEVDLLRRMLVRTDITAEQR